MERRALPEEPVWDRAKLALPVSSGPSLLDRGVRPRVSLFGACLYYVEEQLAENTRKQNCRVPIQRRLMG
jgi:hypothetical protein